ncbi:hypothetical protein BH10PLA1_BH10PLA1_19440 [soil metagenome]
MSTNYSNLIRRNIVRRAMVLACMAVVSLNGCGKGDDKKSTDPSATPQAAAPTPAPWDKTSAGEAAAVPAAAPATATPNDQFAKISQYGASEYCSLASGADGTLHAIYTDQPDPYKGHYLYYRSSKDGGATWSDPKNLSDDETATPAAYCRVLFGGDGKVYAIWKYLECNNLDAAGGGGSGELVYRVLDGGAWSSIVRLNDKHHGVVSYFAAIGPDGKVNLVYSQGNLDIDWLPMGAVNSASANLIRQAVLNGPTPQIRDLITPAPIPTRAQVDAAHAAGHDIPYEDQYAKADGLWDLRGYITADGSTHFIADHQEPYPNPDSIGAWITYYDGKQLHKLHEYQKGDHETNYSTPWTLLLDSHGKEHVIRIPFKAEKQVVRDYPVVNGALGDPVDIVGPDKPSGSISTWQACGLSGGGMAVTASISQKGGWAPDDLELYISNSNGDGKWSSPTKVTHNTDAGTGMSKGAITTSTTYYPKFAELATTKNGMGLIMVNTAHGVVGVNNAAVTGSGRVVTGLSSYSSDSPWVFYTKVQ